MHIRAVLWGSEIPMIRRAGQSTGIEVQCWATCRLKDPKILKACREDLMAADLILLHPTQDAYRDDRDLAVIDALIRQRMAHSVFRPDHQDGLIGMERRGGVGGERAERSP
jgi:hypothetical protein